MSEHQVDLVIRKSALAKARLRVTPDHIQWDDRRVELRHVHHVAAYGHTITMNFVWAGGQHKFWFADDQGEVTVAIPDTRAPTDRRTAGEATEALHHAVFTTVAPRLVTTLVERIDAGEAVQLGGHEAIKPPTAGIPGMVARRSRNRRASTLVVDRNTLELRGEGASKASWSLADVTGATIEQAQIVLLTADRKTTLIPSTYRDVILLPLLLQRLKSA